MVRERKFEDMSCTEEVGFGKLMETILEDILKAQAMPSAEWQALSSNPFAPLAIPTSQDRQYPVTQVGVEAAHALTRKNWELHEEFRQTIDRDAFTRLSFNSIGDTLHAFGDSLTEGMDDQNHNDAILSDGFGVTLAESYQVRLQQLATTARPDVDQHIPCHLFHLDQGVPAFDVGPVSFLPRAEWLNLYVKDSEVHELIGQVECRQMDMAGLISQSLSTASGRNASRALDVLHTLRNYGWVATVRIEGHENKRSHLKASVLVGLAIDAIGLKFNVENARCFTKAGKQHLFAENWLTTTLDGRILHGSTVQMPGVGGRPGAMIDKMTLEQTFLKNAGNILQCYIDGRRKGHALHLVERWTNSLYWVGEARREASDFMAVVNYGCAADVLSGAGGKAKEMISFAEAALKPEGDVVPTGVMTVSAAVHKVYREGRNKLAHGEMSGLLEDLAKPRAVGEALLIALFDVVTPVLANLLQNEPNFYKLDEHSAFRLLKAKLETNKVNP